MLKAGKNEICDYAFIGLGSNLGDSVQTIHLAISRLQQLSDAPLLKSSLWQTVPVDCPPESPMFVNAVVGLLPRRAETPESLHVQLVEIEREFGRRPKKILNEPRPLDLDLISFGRETRGTDKLTLPHPRAPLRRFVLQPLAEIAPRLVLPGETKTVCALLNDLPPGQTIDPLCQSSD